MRRLLPILLLALVACSTTQAETPATNTSTPPTATPLTVVQVTQTTAQPTDDTLPADIFTLTIWWPETLDPVNRPDVTALIGEQIEAFATAENNLVELEFRLKRYGDVGGIMSTLRAANNVAPGALPDLTLIRREDLISAVQSGLVFPMEGLIPTAILGDLYDPALELGQVNGTIYGLPYVLDVRHLAYYVEADDAESGIIRDWSYDAILDRGQSFVFPAERTNGINSTFYVQYLAAGGTPPDASGQMVLNADALETVLDFYEQAREQDIIMQQVLDYGTIGAYIEDLQNGDIASAIIDSTSYFSLRAEDTPVLAAPIPTDSGEIIAALNGWMWVLTTDDLEQQVLASRFLNWMFDTDRQRNYVETLGTLPSQRATMQQIDNPDAALMDSLLANARVLLTDNSGGTLPRLMQGALVAVLNGELTAEEAVAQVEAQLSS